MLHTLYPLSGGPESQFGASDLKGEVLTFDWTVPMPNGGSGSSLACLHLHVPPSLHPPDVN